MNIRWVLWFWPNIELLSRPNNTVTIFCSHGNLYISFYHATSQGVFLNWYDSLFSFPKELWIVFETHSTQTFLFIYSCKCVSMETMLISAAVLDSHLSVDQQHKSTLLHVVTVLRRLVLRLYLKFFSVFEFSHTGIVCFSLKKSTKSLTSCRFRHMIWAHLHTD